MGTEYLSRTFMIEIQNYKCNKKSKIISATLVKSIFSELLKKTGTYIISFIIVDSISELSKDWERNRYVVKSEWRGALELNAN